ncbi:hypothetical protein [Luteipulveratus halotolerans]|uniref:Uncharacterized protein n=1 Tax=Luteipulveratus halotolerans TaxID=1631356 RepID=A0A0L6CN40_9MICO|nr:hypothetical protein [Luteipulveratus halotolerans]KNX39070.1 hypothetical protein VV01_21185 [Luteipulveratus halotolerans]
MSVIGRLYDLSPGVRATIGFACVLATFGLMAANVFWLVALLPFVVAMAVVNRLVPGGRLTLVPRVDPGDVVRRRLPFSLLAAAVFAAGSVAALMTDDTRWAVVGAAVTVAITFAADALAPTRTAAARS